MPAAGVVMIVAVVLIVLALVYYLVSTIVALRQIADGLDEAIGGVGEIIEKSAPVNDVVNAINAQLDAGVDLLEGLLVKKAGLGDAMGLIESVYPGAAADGLRNFPESTSVTPTRIGEVYTLRHAHARAPRPRGADRRRQPGRLGAPQRRGRQPGRAAALPQRPPGEPGEPPELAGHRHGRPDPIRTARRHRGPAQATAGTRRLMQTPAPFEYERATSVEGAIAALERLGGDARIIAGGHSLLPMMKLRLANPAHLVDINDLTELSYIREQDGEVRIGALTRHVELLDSELLARQFPVIRDAETVIADPVVRNRGTIGGSLCQADAAEDLSAVCAALKARVVIRGTAGERVVDMEDFHVGPFTTAVGAGEVLTEIRLAQRPGAGSAHEKVERRAGDWAIAAASAAVWLDGGAIADAGIALSAVGLTTIHLTRAEELLRGKQPSDELFAEAGEIASADCSPSADGRGPVDYKRHLAGVLTQRALRRATARALGQEA